MSFPQYPAYKDSGVEWLGKIPATWSVGSTRWLTRRYSGGTPDRTNSLYWEGGTIPWLNSGAVNDRLITEPSTYITEDAFESSSVKWIPKGALVMALAGQGKTKGMVAQLAIPSTCNQSMAAIIPSTEVDARFLFWWLESNYQNIRNMAGGDLRDGLNLDLLGSIKCPLPSHEEQTDIAAFLDRETAKIDALVVEQEQLIELLKKKRQAVISHTVTKGLDPSVPMKDSGLEWLGEVPAHWGVLRIKSLSTFLTSGPRGWSDRVGDSGAMFVQSGDLLESMQIDFENAKRVSVEGDAEAVRTRLADGDVVVCITGAKTGNVAVCTTVPEDAYVNQHLCLIRPSVHVMSEFLGIYLKSDAGQKQFSIAQYGLKQGLSLENVKDTVVALPPTEEQARLVSELRQATDQVDTLIDAAEDAIRLLFERRTALISAAVTGQIDVRGLAPALSPT